MKMQIELTITKRWWIDSPCQARAEKYCADMVEVEKNQGHVSTNTTEITVACGILTVVIP